MTFWIAIAALLIAPFAWMFSKRIAAPIRDFALAAEQLGPGRRAAPVEVRGAAEIQSAAVALNEMQARLERFVAERTSMVGVIAHDLRTPLAGLVFHLAHVPEDVGRRADKEVDEMDRMIATALDFVPGETHQQPYQRLDLGALVDSVVDDLADSGFDAHVSGSVPVTMASDPFLLRRVFTNLIANAVAYGKQADVAVTVSGASAIVEVIDQGPGLSGDELARVFEPFYRGDSSRNRATGGIGLGLTIVQTAVRHHGGTVALTNRPGGGLRARVTLPISG